MNDHISDILRCKYKKALVTGGAGFIGSHLVDALLDAGLEVVSIDNYIAGKPENISHLQHHPKFREVQCDVLDFDKLDGCFDGVDIVFHEAASKKNVCLKDPRLDLRVNGEGTFNLLELSLKHKVKKFVHASTGSVYGEAKIFPEKEDHPLEPVSYYGVSKLAGERYTKAFEVLYGLDATILRYFHVYGPRQESGVFGGVIAIFARTILEGKNPTIFGDGFQERSFTYVKDVVNANLYVAATDGTKGECYNCASGINITINQICEILLDTLDKNRKLHAEYRDWLVGDIKKFQISNEKLKNLGFRFQYDFDTGLRETVQFFEQTYKR